jgi:hypothetical protein
MLRAHTTVADTSVETLDRKSNRHLDALYISDWSGVGRKWMLELCAPEKSNAGIELSK